MNLPAEYAPSSGYIVPRPEATELVDYLLSLDRTYTAEELPVEEELEDVDAEPDAGPAASL